MKKRIHFIVNPRSGDRKKEHLKGLIDKVLRKDEFEVTLTFTTHGGHAHELASESVKQRFDIVVAAGGDGTINEVASQLIGTHTALAIIPYGSGNGFARHLGINLNDAKALLQIAHHKIEIIDVGYVNGFPFFCTSGVGFDSLVGERFEQMPERGLRGYIRTVWSEIRKFNGLEASWTLDRTPYSENVFMFTAANAGQFGNNAWIAPLADLSDGLLDFCIVKPFALWRFPSLGWKMFRKTLCDGKHYRSFKATECKLRLPEKFPFHADGEIKGTAKEIHWTIKEGALKVVVPKWGVQMSGKEKLNFDQELSGDIDID